jgi:hypothetical protein
MVNNMEGLVWIAFGTAIFIVLLIVFLNTKWGKQFKNTHNTKGVEDSK